jgi:dCTP deaminase
MPVIFDKEIKRRSYDHKLIDRFTEYNLWGASYDMRLGRECAKNGEVIDLEKTETLSIMPGEFALFTTYEFLNIPLNMVGRNGIMSKWAKQGVISLFSPQIDPGFEGLLIVPVFNAGDQEVLFRYMDNVFTVEFDLGEGEASFGWTARMGRQERLTADHLKMLDVKTSLYKDVLFTKGKLEALQTSVDSAVSSFSETKGKVNEYDKHMESFRNEINATVQGHSKNLDIILKMLRIWVPVFTAVVGILIAVIIRKALGAVN